MISQFKDGFDVQGLNGYKVKPDLVHGQTAGWSFYSSIHPHTFIWNEKTEMHDVPVVDPNFAIGGGKTAKQAVFLAHKHHNWIKNYKPKKG